MKKLFLLMMAVATVFVITACSSETPNDPETDIPSVTEEPSSIESEELNSTKSEELNSTKSEETSSVESEELNSTESEESSDIKYADMIPDPEKIFENGTISVVDKDGGKAYIFQVRNFEETEYETYVSLCKEMGFTDVSYETENDGGKMFGAYTEDGKYWVEVLLGNLNGILAVTCKESTKN